MFRVAPDPARNELTIAYVGRVSPEETRRCREQMREALASLEPGFRLIVDLTGLERMDLACASVLATIMERCNVAGVAEVVRIIPDPTRDIGLQILSFFHYGNNVCIRTCASAAEVDEIPAMDEA
jgi:anti-anti-sigma regulatory factor